MPPLQPEPRPGGAEPLARLRFLSARDGWELWREFVDAGLAGERPTTVWSARPRAHRLPLISCDRRAESTYRALGVGDDLLSPVH